jgi:hypothetical protein
MNANVYRVGCISPCQFHVIVNARYNTCVDDELSGSSSVIRSAASDAGQFNQTDSAAGMSALRVGHNCQARDNDQGLEHHAVVALHAM